MSPKDISRSSKSPKCVLNVVFHSSPSFIQIIENTEGVQKRMREGDVGICFSLLFCLGFSFIGVANGATGNKSIMQS